MEWEVSQNIISVFNQLWDRVLHVLIACKSWEIRALTAMKTVKRTQLYEIWCISEPLHKLFENLISYCRLYTYTKEFAPVTDIHKIETYEWQRLNVPVLLYCIFGSSWRHYVDEMRYGFVTDHWLLVNELNSRLNSLVCSFLIQLHTQLSVN
jgi:hypothetical protein